MLNASSVVTCYTRPDILTSFFDTASLSYERIVGAYLNDGYFGDSVMLPDEHTTGESKLKLPRQVGNRLFTSLRMLANDEQINCHKFSRIITDRPAEPFCGDSQPITFDHRGLSKVTNVALGKVGLVGVEDCGITHSVIGLGEDTPESLQVMSSFGELGVAPNDAMLDFYRRLHPNRDVGLYELDV